MTARNPTASRLLIWLSFKVLEGHSEIGSGNSWIISDLLGDFFSLAGIPLLFPKSFLFPLLRLDPSPLDILVRCDSMQGGLGHGGCEARDFLGLMMEQPLANPRSVRTSSAHRNKGAEAFILALSINTLVLFYLGPSAN